MDREQVVALQHQRFATKKIRSQPPYFSKGLGSVG